jgi:hypothetical protein
MTAQPRVRDLTPHHSNSNEAPAMGGTPAATGAEAKAIEAVVSGAVLVAAAFRLRDEESLTTALRELTNAVAALERAQAPA